MDGIKILHCSDIHFDTPFSELPAGKADIRREELRETFGKIIDLAKSEAVQLILMPGDIFDNASVSKLTIEYIVKKLGEIEDIKIFIAPGNHDANNEKSFYKAIKWPANVHVFGSSLEKVQIHELNTCIYGIGFSKSHERNSLIHNARAEDESLLNIMVVHGDVINGSGTSEYNPIDEQSIINCGMDYLAFGHQHNYSGIMRSGRTHWAYCGCPEGRGFDETGSKGIIIGYISKDHVNLDFKAMSKRKHICETIDISSCSTYSDIELKIREQLGLHNFRNDLEKRFSGISHDLYKITLVGEVSQDFNINTSVIESKIGELFFHVKVTDSTSVKIDYENLEKEYSLKGIFVRKLREMLQSEEDENKRKMLLKVMKCGLYALDNREVPFE